MQVILAGVVGVAVALVVFFVLHRIRAAYRRYMVLYRFVADQRDHGLRSDLNPTLRYQAGCPEVTYEEWSRYLKRIDRNVRFQAGAVLTKVDCE